MRGALAPVLFLCGACAGGGAEPTTLSVFAASSLRDAFEALASDFEAQNAGTRVVVSSAGSQVLSLQVARGAPADVFASADRGHVQALVDGGHAEPGERFARNALAVIVPRGDPAGIRAFAGLRRARRLVIGTEAVPAGAYARALLARADAALGDGFAEQVLSRVVSTESNVRLLRAKVELGEADAAIVYRTDALGSDALDVIEVPAELSRPTECHLAVVARSPRRALAARFVDHVRSTAGQRVLAAQGFLPP